MYMRLNYRTLNIEIRLVSHLTIIGLESATGKSYFSNLIQQCDELRNKVTVINYKNNNVDGLLHCHAINGDDALLIIDNADLYQDKLKSILRERTINGYIIIMCKFDFMISGIVKDTTYGECILEHNLLRIGVFENDIHI